jgi:hypothetical protein
VLRQIDYQMDAMHSESIESSQSESGRPLVDEQGADLNDLHKRPVTLVSRTTATHRIEPR